MYTTLQTQVTVSEYNDALGILDRMGCWDRQWAARQYIGLVVTGMCMAVAKNEIEGRQFVILRLLDVLLEHQFNLLPATALDFLNPRDRVAKLSIPEHEEECEPWLDILEYMQLRNWERKGTYGNQSRLAYLREQIGEEFSEELLKEVETCSMEWWVCP